MDQYLLFALLGAGTGAVFAGLGMGLVTVYKGSGVVNFAHASLGLWGAFVFDELRKSGDLVLPVVGVPAAIPVGTPPLAVAAAVGVLSSALLGALTYWAVFRPLRHSPVVAKIMASIGVLTLLQAIIVRRFGKEARLVEPVFPADAVPFAGLAFPEDRLWLAGAVVLVAAALSAFFRLTLVGLATRASVEDEVALSLARWSPVRLATLNWALGAGVTSLFLVLASPITGLSPASIGLLVVPGLAALLVARLSSVAAAAAAGLGLGVLQSELSLMQTQPWWPSGLPSGTADAVPFIVIVVALAVLGDKLPGRGTVILARMPSVRRRPLRPLQVLVATAAVVAAAPLLGQAARNGLIASMIFAIIALSLVVLVGLVGQVSLGQAAIAGVAAVTLARVTDDLPFPLSIALASLAAVAAGVLMGAPALRIRGAQLAVVTLAGAVAVEGLVLRNLGGGTELKDPRLAGLDLAVQQGAELGRLPFTYAVLAVLVASCVLVSRVINGSTGRQFLAVRSNERAAASVGIDVSRAKLLAFALSSLLAGLGGSLLAYSLGAVSVESFGYFAGITFLLFAFVGGITSVSGALVAGFLAPFGLWYVVLNGLVEVGSIYDIIGGLTLILAAIMAPEGVARLYADAFRKAAARMGWSIGGSTPGGPTAAPALPERAPAPDAAAATPSAAAALEAKGVHVRYGGAIAVDDVSLTVAAGQIHGLIGPNGAGKTSLLDAITGFCRATGDVRVAGVDIGRMPPHRRQRAGMARTWQSSELFGDLSVLDNVLVAAHPPRPMDMLRDVFRPTPSIEVDAARALDLVGLGAYAALLPEHLSTGQQKLLGLARALASRPQVLLCDEPAAGLDTAESEALGQTLRAVAETGIAIVLIEHDLPLVLKTCDEITVLDFGHVVAHGTPEQVRTDPAVVAAYIGTAEPPADTLPLVGGTR